MTPEESNVIAACLDAMLANKPVSSEMIGGALPQEVEEKLIRLSQQIVDAQQFSLRLSTGDLDATPPPRSNRLAGTLKQLHAQMLHLTWQAQRIAQGDYKQKIDFMGDFSDAFNEMVDQLKHRDETLREQQRVMEHVFNLIEPILLVAEENHSEIFFANRMAAQRFGVHEDQKDPLSPTVEALLAIDAEAGSEQEFYDGLGKRWYSVAIHAMQWGGDRRARLYYCRDITAHKQRESMLDIEANTDKLTNISNRRSFDNAYPALWSFCRKAKKPLSVILFDIDRFKQFNDTYGHMEGDKVLVAFAGVLKRCIGRSDDVIARFGGEEFIAALPLTGLEHAIDIANRVCEMTRNQVVRVRDAQGEMMDTTFAVSGGVASIIPTADIEAPQLILAADHALYQAKQSGRDRICNIRTAEFINQDCAVKAPTPGPDNP